MEQGADEGADFHHHAVHILGIPQCLDLQAHDRWPQIEVEDNHHL